MSDLMRKEFEVWAESRGMDLYCSRKNIYVESETLWAWSSWKASRECLVIELPAEPECPEDPDEAIDDSHMDAYHSAIRMRNACRDSIHAAGVKTK